ncbi:hypothetical protein ACQJBY_016935 [Aegilops geniculata]
MLRVHRHSSIYYKMHLVLPPPYPCPYPSLGCLQYNVVLLHLSLSAARGRCRNQRGALRAVHRTGLLLAVLPRPFQGEPALPPREGLVQHPASDGRRDGRRRTFRRAPLGHRRRHHAQVRHDVDEGASLLDGQPGGARPGRPRPPLQLRRPARVRPPPGVPALHAQQGPGPRRAPGPEAPRHARPARVAAEVRRRVGVPDRVRVPRPQGHPGLDVELREQVQGRGRAGADPGRGRRRLLLRRRVGVRAVLGPRPRVLARAPGEPRAGALLPVRGDEPGPCGTRAEAGRVCWTPVQRGGGGRRRGGRRRQAVLVRAHDWARSYQERQDGACVGRCGEQLVLPARPGRGLGEPSVVGDSTKD